MPGEFNLLQAQRAVFACGLNSLEKLMALALLDHWSRSAETFPSVDRLAKWTSLCRRSVLRSLAALEAKGAVCVARSHGRANRYDLRLLMAVATNVPRAPVPHGHQCPTGTSLVTDSLSTSASLAPEGTQERNPMKEPNRKARAGARRGPNVPVVNLDPEEAAKHQALVLLYFERFEAVRGTKPPFDARDGNAVKQLLAKCGAETGAAAIRGAFADTFWRGKATIRTIANEPAKFVGLKAHPPGRGARQPNGGAWKPEVEGG